MISPQQFASQWQACSLRRVEPEILEKINLPHNTKEFLSQIGLPIRPMFDLYFDILFAGIPRLIDYWHADSAPSFEIDRYRLLGQWKSPYSEYTVDNFVCIEEGSGVIVSLYLEDIGSSYKDRLCFFNSSVPQMAECFLIYENLRRSLFHGKTYEELEASWQSEKDNVAKAFSLFRGEELNRYLQDQLDAASDSPNDIEINAFVMTFEKELKRIDPRASQKKSKWPNILRYG